MRKLIIETGPVGDHSPEKYELPESPGIFLMEDSSLQITDLMTDRVVANFDGDDWTQFTVVNHEEL